MTNGIAAAVAIARKDLRTEWRTRESLNASVSFSLVILVLFSFAFDLDRDEKLAISGGLFWLVYAFAGALIVNRSFSREMPNDCLEVLIAPSPASGRSSSAKSMACFMLLTDRRAGFASDLRAVLQHSLGRLVLLAPACDSVGDLGNHRGRDGALSAVTVNVRLRELMLPVLLYPSDDSAADRRDGNDERSPERQRRAERHPAADRIRCDVHVAGVCI